jgi:hypothetical protein
MKRLLAIAVAVGMFFTHANSPALGQTAPKVVARGQSSAARIKTAVKLQAMSDPKHRTLLRLLDGSSIIGRIREVHENDFVFEPTGNQPLRTIAYTELAKAPVRDTPLVAKIAEDTGLCIVIVIFSPLIFLAGITGAWD